jgi:hypothetical protein
VCKGNVISTLFKGDEECDSAVNQLQSAVVAFNSALSHFCHSVEFQTFNIVKGEFRSYNFLWVGIREDFASLLEHLGKVSNPESCPI